MTSVLRDLICIISRIPLSCRISYMSYHDAISVRLACHQSHILCALWSRTGNSGLVSIPLHGTLSHQKTMVYIYIYGIDISSNVVMDTSTLMLRQNRYHCLCQLSNARPAISIRIFALTKIYNLTWITVSYLIRLTIFTGVESVFKYN